MTIGQSLSHLSIDSIRPYFLLRFARNYLWDPYRDSILSRLSQPCFIAHAQSMARQLDVRLAVLPEMFPEIIAGPARGRGLLRGVPFKNTEDPAKIVKLARERGVLLLTAGKDAIRLVPSLNIGSEEVNHALDVFESCLYVLQQQA
jgi:acetylornithine aminotransferase